MRRRPFLPSSAKAFAPRDKPYIVLNPKYSDSLAKVLRQAKPEDYTMRKRKDSSRQATLLSILLAPDTAIWTICETDLFQVLYQAGQEYGPSQASLTETRYIQAHVVHVDTISRNEMSFKLTSETIQSLIEFYDINISCHLSSSISNEPQKSTAPYHKDPKQAFVRKINGFVFCTPVSAFESLKSDGTGTLLGRQAMAAREAIERLLVSVIATQQEGSLPQQAGSLPQQAGSLPQQEGSLPQQEGSLPQQEGRLSQQKEGLLPTQERGQIGSFNSHSSFEPWSIEEVLPNMTIPYRPLAHTVYTDQSSSLGAVWGPLPLLSRDEQQFPAPYAQFSSRSSLLQWPSTIAGETGDTEEFDESGRHFMSG
ncbi:hypothetical protein N7520_009663 [Penicillium odoratum]|uniref:uncharacterized protein n=1 Tax=Penicillium odoratum TaxID=1167516 RepID=UPI00254905F6|nr:uncharacterized protein N7520_009663 [Penicillium odoratum]KAJ5752746.1 hypothetical protein N7520_009663 [Penicillium odoratum]